MPETIGERAAEQIRDHAKGNGTSIKTECKKLDIQHLVVFDRWEKKSNPHAYFLAQMALAGYDIYYILTGVRTMPRPQKEE